MPGEKSDNNVVDRQIAECSGCQGWFHRMCERIPTAIFQEKSKDWYCFQCISNEKVYMSHSISGTCYVPDIEWLI